MNDIPKKMVPGTSVISRVFSEEGTFDEEPVAAVSFTGTQDGRHFSVKWFHSEEEASLWLDSEGIPYEVLGFRLDFIRLYSTGELSE